MHRQMLGIGQDPLSNLGVAANVNQCDIFAGVDARALSSAASISFTNIASSKFVWENQSK